MSTARCVVVINVECVSNRDRIINKYHQLSQYMNFVDSGFLDLANLAISSLLTLFLVLLYRKQTRLNEYEMERDARKIHSDVIRERIRYWLGATDEEDIGIQSHNVSDFETNPTRLPRVQDTDIESAPVEGMYVLGAGDEVEFSVIPDQLQEDRYFQDFLTNHGGPVEDLVNQISERQAEFASLRDEFIDECSVGKTIEEPDYTLEPIQPNYNEWIFRSVVKLERGIRGKQKLKNIVESAVTGTGIGAPGGIAFRAENPDTKPTVYKCEFDGIGHQDYQERGLDDEVQPAIIESLHSAIDQIDSEEPFDKARKAGRLLDQLEEPVAELERQLVIYEGKPLYEGDCEYLDEASVDVGLLPRLK